MLIKIKKFVSFIHNLPANMFSSFYFTNFMNTKEYTFTIKMYNISRKKERKKTNCKLQKSNLTILLLQIDCK